ncbi:MAG TPA: hypothetical protein VMI06_14640 [Terriglobia bacterium]|nr:hypothetical protein [Terriglobia bacterium]
MTQPNLTIHNASAPYDALVSLFSLPAALACFGILGLLALRRRGWAGLVGAARWRCEWRPDLIIDNRQPVSPTDPQTARRSQD